MVSPPRQKADVRRRRNRLSPDYRQLEQYRQGFVVLGEAEHPAALDSLLFRASSVPCLIAEHHGCLSETSVHWNGSVAYASGSSRSESRFSNSLTSRMAGAN